MRVLISAYACSPTQGSEPGIGWNWAAQAAKNHDVWLLTREDNRDAIQQAIDRSRLSNLFPIYHDLPRFMRWLRKVKGLVYLHYWLWQLTAIPKIRKLCQSVQFDLGHHVTYGSFRAPSVLAWLDIPFIWGPIAGADRPPRRFYLTFGKRGMAIQLFRDASNLLARLDPLIRRTARKSACIIAVTHETRAWLSPSERHKVIVMPAIGMSSEQFRERPNYREGSERPFRLLFVGNLYPWKGVQLALPAVASAIRQRPDVDITFTIVGDGPFRGRLIRLAKDLTIANHVDFVGKLARDKVLDIYASHDLFVFPSLQDSGGFAVLEAMAAGMPVVCLNLGGPGLSVTNETGWRVEATNPDATIEALAEALLWFIDDPCRCAHAGDMARARVLDVLNWDRLNPFLDRLYETAVRQPNGRSAIQASPATSETQLFELLADFGIGDAHQNC